MKKKRLSFEQFWIKKNNQDHTSKPRLVATSHRGDRKFLGKNVISTTENV